MQQITKTYKDIYSHIIALINTGLTIEQLKQFCVNQIEFIERLEKLDSMITTEMLKKGMK